MPTKPKTKIVREPRIDERPAQPYMGISIQTPFKGMFQVVDKLHKQLFTWAKARGLEPAGPTFLRYHVIDMDGSMDIEVGFPVVALLPDEGPICAGVLPAGRYASLVYVRNGYIGNKTLNEWAATNGIQVEAMKFGQIDQSDFLIPSFALFYIYTIFAAAFRWPILSRQQFFHWEILSWLGVFCCLAGVVMLWLSLFSFGKSFRVGIDTTHPDELVTTGIFALTRTPIYVAFGLVLIGQFLIFSNWILLVYLVAAVWLFHRQVLREEAFMKQHYGKAYTAYCQRIKRYL